jgi:hypothetical protein
MQFFMGKSIFFLIDVLNKSYDEMLLNFSHRTSALSPLFKNGDPLVLDNSRPISLLVWGAAVVVIVWELDLKLPVQSVVFSCYCGFFHQ